VVRLLRRQKHKLRELRQWRYELHPKTVYILCIVLDVLCQTERCGVRRLIRIIIESLFGRNSAGRSVASAGPRKREARQFLYCTTFWLFRYQ